MIPYLIIIFLAILFSFISLVEKKDNKYLLFVFLIILGIFSGSRYNIGGSDFEAYKYMYESTSTNLSQILRPNQTILINVERGYILIMSLSKKVGLNFNQFLLILGLSSSLFLFILIKNYTNFFFLFLFLFICKGYLYYFFTAQRQIIAMCICWYSIKFVLNRKIRLFSLCVIIASFFHISALVFFIVYFTYKKELKNKTVLLLVAISIILGAINIGPRLMIIFSNFIPVGGEKLIEYSSATGNINLLNFIEILPLLLLVLCNRSVISRNTKHFSFFFPLFLIYIFINFAFYDFSIMTRVRGYFIIGYISIIASIPYSFKTQAQKNIMLVVLILYFSAVFIRELMVFDGGTGYLPYNSYLF